MGEQRFVQVENIAQFRRALRKADAEVKKAVREYDKRIAAQAGEHAPEFAPKRTGALAGRIKAGADNKGGFIESTGLGKHKGQPPPIHWGWPSHSIPRSGYIIRSLGKVASDHGGAFEDYYLDGLMDAFRFFGDVSKG